MIRRPPRSTLSSSSAASDVYKRQVSTQSTGENPLIRMPKADPEPKSAAGGGINWKRQGIILAISIGIAFYMVGRTVCGNFASMASHSVGSPTPALARMVLRWKRLRP
eukprot:TRINITY_DN1644_c0_g1_i4.p2 TRINITY_DN1644_c0_g1~~TRINITY_DN1644_c0_g1_i4.p2  ORF type:complete len:108 (+),score=17.20 TRINITY_DN1644_c0_g1_i4:136-459(+)